MTNKGSAKSVLHGIDVSNHQQNVDWNQVANSGISFVFIKATEGGSFVDKFYKNNIAEARSARLPCGAYHFFRPKIPVQDQVNNFVRTVKKLERGDLKPVLDLEVAHEWDQITPAKRIQMVGQWADEVKASLNTEPIIYLSSSFAKDVLFESEKLLQYPLWVAHYTDQPEPAVPHPWNKWTFWQYTNRGRVEGIETAVDLDLFNGTPEALEELRIH